VTVFAVDAFKGASVMAAALVLDLGVYDMFAVALGVVVGHNFPVFLGFRGGKGVASIFGLSMAVLPLLTLASVGLSLASGLATRNVVFGIGVGFVALNILTIATAQDAAQIGLCLTLSALVIATLFALSYNDVMAAVRKRGPWGLFEVE